MRMRDLQMTEAVVTIGMFCLLGLVLYLFFSGYRGRQQADLQRALIEKFSSAQDFAAFLQTEAGQRFATELGGSGSPLRNVVRAVQLGIVLSSLGAGFIVMGGASHTNSMLVIAGIGLLLNCVG